MPRVALTTTTDRASGLFSVALAHGLRPISLPCIEVTTASESILGQARLEIARSDWLVVTSARTVEILWPEGNLPAVEVAAVGRQTATAVARAGGKVSLVGDSGAAELVVSLAGRVAGRYVHFPHGRGANLSNVNALQDAGAMVSTLEVYATTPVPPNSEPVDAAAFGSPSAVEGWFKSRDLEGIVVAAIGGSTSAALADRGHPADIVPDRPDYVELLELLSIRMKERIGS